MNETRQTSKAADARDLSRIVARRSAAWYTAVSLAAAAVFVAAASLAGGFGAVALIGGSVWVFLLSMIVSMPLVAARVKKRVAKS